MNRAAIDEWNAYPDIVLLRTLAGAMIELDAVTDLASFSLPYPPEAQRALDRLILLCLLRGVELMPRSVPDLVTWCATRPVEDWPLRLPADAFGPEDYLLDPVAQVPTQLCNEWWVHRPDAAGVQYDREIVRAAMQLCRQAAAPECYTAFRRLLVDRPVLTNHDQFEIATDLYLEPVRELLERCYVPAPASYLRDGAYTTCWRCLTLLVPLHDGTWWCERDACRRKGPARPGRSLVLDEVAEVCHLVRPLRQFVTGPGRAEADLERRLSELEHEGRRVRVEMWPGYDAYDLKITFPDGHVWAIDVKDWKHPGLLGRAATTVRQEPPYDEACWVVPKAQADAHGSYLATFYRNRSAQAGQLPLLTDDTLVRRAAARLAGDEATRLADRTANRGGKRDA